MKNLVSIHLQDPDEPDIDNAYRSLPRTGEIVLTTSFSGLNSQLEHLEQAGFAGMEIKAFGSPDQKMTIRALKGKQGTCYDTGRFASYQGAALAALDDDHHLLIAGEEIPVCEKTATLYSLHLYRGMVNCSDAAKGMLEKLQTDHIQSPGKSNPGRIHGSVLSRTFQTPGPGRRHHCSPGKGQ